MADPYMFNRNQAADKRMVPRERGNTWQPNQLWQRHHEILNLHVLGFKNKDIAAQLGVGESNVSLVINSELAQDKIRVMRGIRDSEVYDVRKEVAALLKPAIDTYKKLLDDKNPLSASPALRKQTADTITLNLNGLDAPKRFEGRVAHVSALLTSDEITDLKNRAIAKARLAGDCIDAEVLSEVEEG